MTTRLDAGVPQEVGLPGEMQRLVERVREVQPQADLDLLRRAYAFAVRAHEGQFRRSGEPYVMHSVAVAHILADLRMDTTTVAAALLHDVPEDTPQSLEEVRREFGDEIATLVDGVTKLGKIQWRSQEEKQAENLRKMFLAMASDVRIILIKLADRLHNLRTIDVMPPEHQRRKARETLEIYAPLAKRLGIGQLQNELEDRAFAILEPEAYREIMESLREAQAQQEEVLRTIQEELYRELNRAGIRVERQHITARPKHAYSIYRKMQRPAYQGQGIARIYDRLGVRVIVDDVKDCYAALGVVHSLWRPIPGEFDDYIANPKPSGYQSLHTTVIYRGVPLEIQIRTHRMHQEAEYGIAAHWRYKEGKAGARDRAFEEKLSWLRQLLEWHQEMQDAQEFMRSVKLDLFRNEVFVFTPKGDVVDLPSGATPVDFAYRIHTDVGHRCVGARVNGRLVPLSYRLHSGDIVEILTSKTSTGPSRDWLEFVVTSNARTKIRQWFRKQQREENVARGKEMLERELRRLGLLSTLLRADRVKEACEKLQVATEEDLYAALGNGDLTLLQVVHALGGPPAPASEPAAPQAQPATSPARGLRVRGVDNVLMTLARCCMPLPGDDVVGYITRGRGVTIHRRDCRNLDYLRQHGERLLEVEWEPSPDGSYPVEIQVEALDRVGLLKDVLSAVADTRTNVLSVNAHVRRDKVGVIHLTVDIRNVGQLTAVLQRIGKLPDVYRVERLTAGGR
ncbi:MAG: bifunctional (p)ppGpp synthetase/guanosine-3',5'-bis(diphosphate) 3'-pyrophosphohydrolase [Armatimonadota bacterium]|nr:bifunctional (p)ppGpp synthetase/guanosine-3',5'-bis(diphosphate) 3'-pyrophosphohydrolase [Armatimonadota bacterium]MDR5676635.1 bifunctional (p)ppGpp synthetase/guanosine-3',5'-bis(diphosphate) 3'-pyrophosphohydrolase [Armatimonadota bacterium]MDR7389066.1 bifunctional (p)ppGpp synthetase/guanosine-3',5'-bis(diphosphate) 3'-pyrophosphohydrolase [Armatimonadota bacterium]MDR7397314.1 bifunctional (p)ppGpp synthetase/guanosine-3',5'-bis(diphosphate) 3'-pyrophosphohydrolase [Armatimonadota bact